MSTGDAERARTSRRRRRSAAILAAAVAPTLVAGCSGSDDGPGSGPLAQAQQELQETSGIDLVMSTDRVPPGSDGLLRLEGVATGAPAFDGSVKVQVNDLANHIPMVAVDGAVYGRLPYTKVFTEIDPTLYGTTDPAELMDPDHGIAGWLAATEDAEEGDDSVSGSVPGRVVAELFESADRSGTFEATYDLADDRLQRAVLTGPFHGAKDTTYTVDISQYDVSEDITKP